MSRRFISLARNFNALANYAEARDQWLRTFRSLNAARLRVAFTGLDRTRSGAPLRPALAAIQARLGQPADAWQALKADPGRGLLDDLAARPDRGLTPGEGDRLRELTTQLEKLDKLVESTPAELRKAERARRFEDLKRQRELAGIVGFRQHRRPL
jgi:hypothetical protein